ncbi:hypothetical protein FRB96_005965 [Tulasnella sp. 330]|nr:hypothetical protein FRB96_005965 [Tulasnella sp. 330]KAG8879684.1 hypothetical protein FRB97_001534 [Tulasnella sp. 331]KAG8888560.1 hypothetical protein FRB98_007425 [Tulasnella sp. 332]
MRFSTILIAAVTVASVASTPFKRQGGFPTCSLPCLTITSNYGSCSPTDDVCLCNSAAYVGLTYKCFTDNCSPSDAATANAQSASLCAAAAVTVTTASGEIILEGSSTQTILLSTLLAPNATSTAASGAATTTGAAAAAATTNPSAAPSATATKNSANALAIGFAPFLAAAAAGVALFSL